MKVCISFIIPVYNVEDYIVRCIDSILTIRSIDIEIIIVDDGSTDQSSVILRNYRLKDSRIVIIEHSHVGLGYSRNKALDIATGEYIVFVDSDDWIDSDKLLELYSQAIKYNVDMIMGDYIYDLGDSKEMKSYTRIPNEILGKKIEAEDLYKYISDNSVFVPMVWAYIYSRRFLCRIKLKFQNVIHEDELWTSKALSLAEVLIFTRICFYHYFQRIDSIMSIAYTQDRVVSLFLIVRHLLSFTNELRLYDCCVIYIRKFVLFRISELYKVAFRLLLELRDTSISLPKHNFYSLYYNAFYLQRDVRFAKNYYTTKYLLKEYRRWKLYESIRCITDFDKLILLYNLPLSVSNFISINKHVITLDRKYLTKVVIVVFYLPTLYNSLGEDVEKQENQKWIGCFLEENVDWALISYYKSLDCFDSIIPCRDIEDEFSIYCI